MVFTNYPRLVPVMKTADRRLTLKKYHQPFFSPHLVFCLQVFDMDTKSLIAIVCVVIAIVILLSLTIYTVVSSWRKISVEYAQRQHSPAAAAHSYENTECIKNEHTASNNNFTEDVAGGTSNEYEKITSDRCRTADSNDRAEMKVHVETKDTRF